MSSHAVFILFVAGSRDRMARLDRLKRLGQCEWNLNPILNKGQLSTIRRPNKDFNVEAVDFETCANCFGSYSKKALNHHFNNCTKKRYAGERVAKQKSRVVEARLHTEVCDALREIVFPSLHSNKSVLSVRFDWIIILFANDLCFNFHEHHHLSMLQQYLRNAAKLLITARYNGFCVDVPCTTF